MCHIDIGLSTKSRGVETISQLSHLHTKHTANDPMDERVSNSEVIKQILWKRPLSVLEHGQIHIAIIIIIIMYIHFFNGEFLIYVIFCPNHQI